VKVREKALSQFGENNIRSGDPMALLEDVLVPVYLFHRYQVEAVAKSIGGMEYSYAVVAMDSPLPGRCHGNNSWLRSTLYWIAWNPHSCICHSVLLP
jgi:hypothetical protein